LRFPLTEQLLQEARTFELRAACRDCFYWNAAQGQCWHGWPDEGQRQWPLAVVAADAADAADAPAVGSDVADAPAVGSEVAFCKEFELR
jgi:hypothetical protein